ncbi:MAG: hypothetical protein GY833_01550 [Aestuariibacter sp.]|nr:hypothetical protein [Aestuariibacter sp.]
MTDINLPQDLVEFLQADRQLKYNPSRCEAGHIVLLPLNQLSLGEVYIDSEESILAKSDPHVGERGYYTVPAVNLVADCDGYDPKGILIWLPDLELFATWDYDHWDIRVFPDVTWIDIVSNPVKYINAQWYPDKVDNELLIPWPRYSFKKGRPWD